MLLLSHLRTCLTALFIALVIAACGGGSSSTASPSETSSSSEEEEEPSAANPILPPTIPQYEGQGLTADAGEGLDVRTFQEVELVGSGYAPEGTAIVSYSWSVETSSTIDNVVELVPDDSAPYIVRFIAPEVDSLRRLDLKFEVVDSDEKVSFDYVNIYVEPPQASETEFNIENVEFIVPIDSSGHTDSFVIQGQPQPGPHKVSIETSGALEDIEYIVMDESGNELGKVESLNQSRFKGLGQYSVGDMIVPTVPFKIKAQGSLRSGDSFEDIYDDLYFPQSISISFVGKRTYKDGDIGSILLQVEGIPSTLSNFRLKIESTNENIFSSLEKEVNVVNGSYSEKLAVAANYSVDDVNVVMISVSMESMEDSSYSNFADYHFSVLPR